MKHLIQAVASRWRVKHRAVVVAAAGDSGSPSGRATWEIVFRLLEEVCAAGNLTTDAHLAALAIEYRAEIATTDTDFARFSGLRWFNPVLGKKRAANA